jgi:hypothetical protein
MLHGGTKRLEIDGNSASLDCEPLCPIRKAADRLPFQILIATPPQHGKTPSSRIMARTSAQIAILAAATAAMAQNCFWRSNSQISSISDWYACQNSRATQDGAQVCCLAKEQCGPDSICLNSTNYYVGGCTDETYSDPVCRQSCSQ